MTAHAPGPWTRLVIDGEWQIRWLDGRWLPARSTE